MFFHTSTKTENFCISKSLGDHAFTGALILMSLYRYDSALVSMISAVESFLANTGDDSQNKDERSIWKKIKSFNTEYPDAQKIFRQYSECGDSIVEALGVTINLRNDIVHGNGGTEKNDFAAKLILCNLMPMLQTVYKAKYGIELTGQLKNEIGELFKLACYLRANGKLTGSDWTRSLFPLSWGLQDFMSPNYTPKFLWDNQEYEKSYDERIYDALLFKKGKLLLDGEELDCPICARQSVGVRFGINTENNLQIERAHCVNCQLELGDDRLDCLISNALFDTYIVQNEARLRKEFGLV